MDELNIKMTAIADEIRELNGGTEKLGLDNMVVSIREGNDEIALQAELLEQAVAELHGKVAPDLYNNGYDAGYEAGKADVPDYLAASLNNTLATCLSDEILTIPNYGFWGRTALERVALKFCVDVQTAAFQGCTSLESISFPACKTIGGTVFRGCSKLTDVDFPILETTSTYAFADCSALKRVYFPALKTLAGAVFTNCAALEYVRLSAVTNIGAIAFEKCTSLSTVVIEQSSNVCALAATSAFNGSPIANGTGFIYVPDTLVERYKTATNWTTYASQIKPLSELEETL